MGIGGAFAVSLLVWAFLNDMSFEKFWIRLWVALKTMAFQHWLATHVGDKQNIRAARHPYQSLRFRCGSLRRSTKSAKRMFFATSTFCDHDRHGRFFQSHWRSSLRSSSYPELLKLIQFLHHPAQKAWHWPQCRHKFPCCCICRFLCFNTAGCFDEQMFHHCCNITAMCMMGATQGVEIPGSSMKTKKLKTQNLRMKNSCCCCVAFCQVALCHSKVDHKWRNDEKNAKKLNFILYMYVCFFHVLITIYFHALHIFW